MNKAGRLVRVPVNGRPAVAEYDASNLNTIILIVAVQFVNNDRHDSTDNDQCAHGKEKQIIH